MLGWFRAVSAWFPAARPPAPQSSPVRYVATFGSGEQLGTLVYDALRLGGQDARAVRAGDNAPWIETQAAWQFPEALWHGDLGAALAALAAIQPARPADPIPLVEETICYLRGQRAWLGNYAAWQEAGYPIGSGLIERAVALVINWRMKRRGMRWRRDNASALVALRVQSLNAVWDADTLPTPLAAWPQFLMEPEAAR